MSQAERRVREGRGKFATVVRDGKRLTDAGWTTGRFVLSNKRLLFVDDGEKRSIPLSNVRKIGGRYDVNQGIARVTSYIGLQLPAEVVLAAPRDVDGFKQDLYSAALTDTVVLARHPAMKGGVVQDTDWEKARIKLSEDTIDMGLASGSFVEVKLDDIGSVETAEREVAGKSRCVVEAEHSIDGTSVKTHFSGAAHHCTFLESLFAEGEQKASADLDLDESDREVLMALYSGVEPFKIPSFTGQDVDEVEETFEWLVEREVLEVVRMRHEVALTTRGRNIASSAMDDE